MPFAALCRLCGTFMIGQRRTEIVSRVRKHFQSAHDKFPQPDPIYLDMSDLEPNTVYLVNDSGTRYTFTSNLFCSKEYCIATITDMDYDKCSLGSRTQEHFKSRLKDYFPPL